ncbi:MAG: glycosyltransferase family 39 protein [Chloroflexota bacterium]|nr:glycosyltransferase family 39 protein [Chloroflexota bacterium]MDE2948666.1 glycosyltransferase family 39 protein [Chloroflexota bacterium]
MKARDRLHLFSMVAVLLLGFALGALQLNADALWLDELYSLSNMGVFAEPFSLTEVHESLAEHSQNHVPLYFFLGSLWARVVGWLQVPMRYLSLLFGVLFIAWLYRFAADRINRPTALRAALLLSTSGFVMMYFHEIRMYTLLLWLTVVHAWLYWRLISRDKAKAWEWFFFIAAASALLYTHVFSLFVFLGLGLHHLVFASRIRQWRRVILAWLLSALTFLPYLPHYLPGALAEQTLPALQASALDAPSLARELAHIVVNGLEFLWLPIVILAALAFRRRRNWHVEQLLIVWAGIVLSLIVFNEVFPVIDRLRFRFFLPAMPFFAILCAHVLAAAGRLRFLTVPFLLIWIAGGLHIRSLGDGWAYAGRNTLFDNIPPLHRYTDALQFKTKELDTVVGFSRSKFVDWPLRHGKSIADYYFNAALGRDHAFIIAEAAERDAPGEIEKLVADHPFPLLVYDPLNKLNGVDTVLKAAEAAYSACEVLVDEETLLAQRYVINPLTCDREYQPVHYDNGIKILDKFAVIDSERGTIRIVTGWEVADEAQLQQYNVSIQIITPDWQNVVQAGDRHLYDDILKWYIVEMPTAGLPPGDYRAVVVLYDRYSNAKVNGIDLRSGETGAILPVFSFTITESDAEDS